MVKTYAAIDLMMLSWMTMILKSSSLKMYMNAMYVIVQEVWCMKSLYHLTRTSMVHTHSLAGVPVECTRQKQFPMCILLGNRAIWRLPFQAHLTKSKVLISLNRFDDYFKEVRFQWKFGSDNVSCTIHSLLVTQHTPVAQVLLCQTFMIVLLYCIASY